MKIRVPEYFTKFNCIADKCLDSCCIGWEIDVDGETMAKYKASDTEMCREIVEKTSHGYLPLAENGRCAFLDERGLCRIISAIGDGYLCDICREHPRYYGVGDGIIEGGLGLSCEEAARIMLSIRSLPKLLEIERDVHYSDQDDFAEVSEAIRERLYSVIFDANTDKIAATYLAYAEIADGVAFDVCSTGESKEIPIANEALTDTERLSSLLDATFDLLMQSEALSDEWYDTVTKASEVDISKNTELLDGARGLLYYFTHRYVREGVEDMSIGARILLAILSTLAIINISTVINSDEALVRAAVLFSKNIEYSTENVDMILEELSEFL